MDDIAADPALRKPIDEFESAIRDEAKRAYLCMGPCQPIGHSFPRKEQGSQMRSFIKTWFHKFDWLEYNVHKDTAYCFYCYLFKPPKTDEFGKDVFTNKGFNNWRKGLEAFKEHVGDIHSSHNYARRREILKIRDKVWAMNIIKTELRNRMNDDWMDNSMVCYIERDIFATIKDDIILRTFQSYRNRRMQLPKSSVTT